MSDQKLARAYDEAMEQIVHLEAEIERLRADKAELLATLQSVKEYVAGHSMFGRLAMLDIIDAAITKAESK